MEILVTNVIKPMKRGESKQLCGYISARCIAMGPRLALCYGFVMQSLLALLLCGLVSAEGEVLGNTALLGTSSGAYVFVWVGETEETTDVS